MRMTTYTIAGWHKFMPQHRKAEDTVQLYHSQELAVIKSCPLTDDDNNLAAVLAEYCLHTEHDLAIIAIYSVYVNEPSINRIISRVCHNDFPKKHYCTHSIASISLIDSNANSDGLIHKLEPLPYNGNLLSGKRASNGFHKPANKAENVNQKAPISIHINGNSEILHSFKSMSTPQNHGRNQDSHTVSKLKGRGSKFVFSTLENLPVLDGCSLETGTQRILITCSPFP